MNDRSYVYKQVFLENFLFGQMRSFWVQKMTNPCNSGSNKMLVWGKWTILYSKMAHPHNFGLARRVFFINFAQ